MYSSESLRTANLSIPKALVDSIGGFDETFIIPCAEDAELGRRLKRALYTTVLYAPEIGCLHDCSPSIDDFAARQQTLGWSTSYMAWRHDDYTLIVGTGASKPTEQFWEELKNKLEGSIERVEMLMGELRDQIETERAGDAIVTLDPDFASKINEIGFAFFSRGLIDGHDEIQSMIQNRSAPSA